MALIGQFPSGGALKTVDPMATQNEMLKGYHYILPDKSVVEGNLELFSAGQVAKSVTFPSSCLDICFDGNKLIAAAKNKCYLSADGITWETADMPHYEACTIAYGNGIYVALAGRSETSPAAYSTDAINWTSISSVLGVVDSTYYRDNYIGWQAVTYGAGKFVAVGWKYNSGGRGTSSYAVYSTNGSTWTKSTLASGMIGFDICYGGNKFIAVGGYVTTSYINYSTNGTSWSSATMPKSSSWRCAVYDEKSGKYVVLPDTYGDGQTGAYSTDGVNWTSLTLPVSARWVSACFKDGILYAAAANSSYVVTFYSWDGSTWTTVNCNTMTTSQYDGGSGYGFFNYPCCISEFGKVFVVGGNDEQVIFDAYTYTLT